MNIATATKRPDVYRVRESGFKTEEKISQSRTAAKMRLKDLNEEQEVEEGEQPKLLYRSLLKVGLLATSCQDRNFLRSTKVCFS